jgi:hypothetical protein
MPVAERLRQPSSPPHVLDGQPDGARRDPQVGDADADLGSPPLAGEGVEQLGARLPAQARGHGDGVLDVVVDAGRDGPGVEQGDGAEGTGAAARDGLGERLFLHHAILSAETDTAVECGSCPESLGETVTETTALPVTRGYRRDMVPALTLSRPEATRAPQARHARGIGNDGLTDVEREELAQAHREGPARQPSERELSDMAAWLRKKRGTRLV